MLAAALSFEGQTTIVNIITNNIIVIVILIIITRAFGKLLCLCCPARCLSRLWTKWKRRLEEEKKVNNNKDLFWGMRQRWQYMIMTVL